RGLDALDEYGELVASQPRHRIARAPRPFQAPRDLDEELVARAMAQRVVHHLEAIEVEEQHCKTAAAASLRAFERHSQALHEERAVRQSGERVVEGGMPELLLDAQAFGH